MRILKMSPYFEPEQVGTTHLHRDLREAYIKAGFTMVDYVPRPTRGISDEVYEEYKHKKYEEQLDGKVIIHRFAMFREGTNPIQRAIRYVLVNLIQYFKGIRAKDVDVLVSVSTPPTQGILCGLVARKLKIPFIYNLQDVFPDSMVIANMTKKGSLIWKIGRKVEDFTYRHADKIIVISEDFKRNIMEKGVPEEKIVVVPNWVDPTSVYPVERKDNILFDRFGLDRDKFYICYSGNIGHSQNLRLLMDAAKLLKTDLPDMRLVLIGDGMMKDELEKMIRDEAIDNVVLLPFQPYEEIAHVFSLGDAGLIISKAGTGGSSVPSKTWSIMAAERPIIASFDEESRLSKLIEEAGCGVTVKPDDLDVLVEAIKTLYNDRENGVAMGKTGRRYLLENLDKEKCVAAYVDTIKSVVEAHTQGKK